ncbi:hypothetical protein Tco_0884711 [Tanacetum coccineum]
MFWATAKANTVNGERQLQALADKKRVIVMESSIRSNLHLADAGGIDCLPTVTIFEEMAWMGAKSTAWNEFSSTMASAIICLATNQKFNFSKYIFDAMVKHLEGGVKFMMYPRFVQVFINQHIGDMSHHKKIYVNPSHTKKIFANMKREGKDFSGIVTPLFATMMVQATQDEGIDSGIPTDSQQTPLTAQPSSSRPQKKQSRRKQRKETEVLQDETYHDDSVPIPSNDLYLSRFERLRKVGESSRVESSKDKESLDDLHDDEVIVDMAVGEKQEKSAKIDEREVSTGVEDSATPTIPVTTADEGVTTAKIDEIIPTYAPTTVIDELTLAQTLIEIKATKPKAVTTDVTTTTTRPKARGVVVQEPSEFRTTTSSSQASQSSKTKDKGKAIMIKPEVPLKRKDQVALDEEMARNLEAQLQAELIKEVEDIRFPVISVYKGFDLLVDKNCCAYQTNRDQKELLLLVATDWFKGKLFEPDDTDTLWKLQRYMHDPLKWWLYDTCVHHVSTERGHDIFMLVEKDYPLTTEQNYFESVKTS